MKSFFDWFPFLRIPETLESDDRRRRQILVIFVSFMQVIAFVVAAIALLGFRNLVASSDGILLLVLSVAFTLFNLFIIALNRSARVPGAIPSAIFVGAVLLAVSVSDGPVELLDGTSVMVWVLPLVISSALFRPSGVFWSMLAVVGAVIVLGVMTDVFPNPFSFFPLFIVAGASWVLRSVGDAALHKARTEAANNRAILANIDDGVVLFREHGDLVSVNPAMSKMLSEDEIRFIVTGEREARVTWDDGRVFNVTYTPVAGMGTVAVFRDITRMVEVERAKDSLIATVSHELRTPLTSIIGYSDLLERMMSSGRATPVQMADMVSSVRAAAARLMAIVSDLLDHAQIEAGALKLNVQSFDPRKPVSMVQNLLKPQADAKSVTLDVCIMDSVPATILGDSNRLYQVLMNLAGNAVKFTSAGRVVIEMDTDDNGLVIRVADTGIGIAPARLPDIFEPFRRGADYATRMHQGAGLGLSISKKLILLMGGTINVESELSKGSVFTVRLPFETPLEIA